MTKADLKDLPAEWLATFAIPPGIDERSREIREVPSHPPPQPPHSELSPRKVPPRRGAIPNYQTRDLAGQSQIAHLPPLG